MVSFAATFDASPTLDWWSGCHQMQIHPNTAFATHESPQHKAEPIDLIGCSLFSSMIDVLSTDKCQLWQFGEYAKKCRNIKIRNSFLPSTAMYAESHKNAH
jgi:hypothetical protein